jgi:hypothetical protein
VIVHECFLLLDEGYIFVSEKYRYQHRATIAEGKGCQRLGTTALCGRAFNSLDWICGFLADDK